MFFVWQPKKGRVLILKYEKGRVPRKRALQPLLNRPRQITQVYIAGDTVLGGVEQYLNSAVITSVLWLFFAMSNQNDNTKNVKTTSSARSKKALSQRCINHGRVVHLRAWDTLTTLNYGGWKVASSNPRPGRFSRTSF